VTDATSLVPAQARPSRARAAAAARLAGVAATEDAVRERMRQAARRARDGSIAPAREAPFRPAEAPLPPGPSAAPLEPEVARVPPAPVAAVAGGTALAVAAPLRRPEGQEQPRPRHLRVVPEGALTPAQRRRRARAVLIAGIGGAAAIGLALVYFHVVLAQRQFAIDRLNTRLQEAQATYQSRRLQVAQLGSPAHIISTAEGQLGMEQPANVSYLSPAGGGRVQGGGSSLGGPAQAPAGDADWPQIKSQLAGTP
jgi:hypothetical protein